MDVLAMVLTQPNQVVFQSQTILAAPAEANSTLCHEQRRFKPERVDAVHGKGGQGTQT